MKKLAILLALLCAPSLASAQIKISGLGNLTTGFVPGSDMIPIVHSGTTYKATPAAIVGAALQGGSFTIGGTLGVTGAFTGSTISLTGTFNTSSTSGYQQYGNTIVTVGTEAAHPAVFVGFQAGQNAVLSQPWATGVGSRALQFYNNASGQEISAFGGRACQHITTSGNLSTCIGLGAAGYETYYGATTSTNFWSGGADNMRNSVGSSNTTSTGMDAGRNGSAPFNTFYGQGAARGNAENIVLGGSVTAGDVITITFASSAAHVSGFPRTTAAYTVVGGDTLTTIAGQLVTKINAIGSLMGDGEVSLSAFRADDFGLTGGPAVIGLDFPGTGSVGWAITVTPNCTGTCTETFTVRSTGFNGNSNVVEGYQAAFGAGLTSLTRAVIIGAKALPFADSDNDIVVVGASAGGTGHGGSKSVVVGPLAGNSLGSGYFNELFVGYGAGKSTTGVNNTILATLDNATSQGCITSGTLNLAVGANPCVGSPTANGQMSIQNAIFGANNTAQNNAISTGQIGVLAKSSLFATFTVGDGAGSATYGSHIATIQTTPPVVSGCTGCSLDAHATDTSGVLTEGTAQTGAVITFNKAYVSAPHCNITSPSGATITSYSTSTTALTIVNPSLTFPTFAYTCIQ